MEDLSSDSVFWLDQEKDKVAQDILARAKAYYQHKSETGLLDLYIATRQAFYGLGFGDEHETSRIVEFGEDGEKLGVRSNQMRSLVKFVYLSATADRPTVKPRAINNAPEALAQVPVARKVLEHYDRTHKIQKHLNAVALRALLYGKGYLWQAWDPFIGPLGPDGNPKGDLVVKAGSPLDVTCDHNNDGEHDWFAIRVRRIRWDLVALWCRTSDQNTAEEKAFAEDLKSKILACSSDVIEETVRRQLRYSSEVENDKDAVYEYHFMHRKTPACPNGRYMIILPDGTCLFTGDLPYDTLPITEMRPEEFMDMGDAGYSSAWDLLGMQHAYDSVMSACMTNHDAYGINDVLLPDGVELGSEEIRDGLNILRYPPGEANRPSILQKAFITKESFELKDWIKGDMELSLSVNSVARGEPEASLESGAALALVQAQAIQAQSPYVQAFSNLVAESADARLRILKAHLDQERLVAIAGNDTPDEVRAYVTPNLAMIQDVECETINPLFRTQAGRQNVADKLLERDLIPSLSAYNHFLETGRLELISDDSRQDDLFGQRIRQMLLSGPPVEQGPPDEMGNPGPAFVKDLKYLLLDDPRVCIAAAKDVLRSFEARKNVNVVNAALTYAMNVFNVWRSTDPVILGMLKYPVPPQGPPGMGGDEDEDGGKGGGGTPPAPKEEAPAKGSGMPSLPSPAKPPPLPKV